MPTYIVTYYNQHFAYSINIHWIRFNKHSLDKIQDCSEYPDYRVSIYSILHSNRLTDFTLDHKITTGNQLQKKILSREIQLHL